MSNDYTFDGIPEIYKKYLVEGARYDEIMDKVILDQQEQIKKAIEIMIHITEIDYVGFTHREMAGWVKRNTADNFDIGSY